MGASSNNAKRVCHSISYSRIKGTTKESARVGRIFYDKHKARWYVLL